MSYLLDTNIVSLGASQMCKFIFCLSSRLEMNEPRRREGHEGKKEEESFWCCCGYFCKIGMLPSETNNSNSFGDISCKEM